MARISGHGIHDAVCADILRHVVPDGHADVFRRAHEKWLAPEVRLGHAEKGEVQRRHDRGNGNAGDVARIELGNGKQVAAQNAVLVCGAFTFGRQPPVGNQRFAGINAQRRVGITNVNHEEHTWETRWGSRLAPTPDEGDAKGGRRQPPPPSWRVV
jgi:hypothetical protein